MGSPEKPLSGREGARESGVSLPAEIQVRQPCSKPALIQRPGLLQEWYCPECSEYTYRKDGLMVHRPVIQWVPLDAVMRLVEEARRTPAGPLS
jgi:hypothetical protein